MNVENLVNIKIIEEFIFPAHVGTIEKNPNWRKKGV